MFKIRKKNTIVNKKIVGNREKIMKIYKPNFAADYLEEAHPAILQRLVTSWATTDKQVERLLKALSEHSSCEKL